MSLHLLGFALLSTIGPSQQQPIIPKLNYVWRPGGAQYYPTAKEIREFVDSHPESEAAVERRDGSFFAKSNDHIFYLAPDLDQLVSLRLKCALMKEVLKTEPTVASNSDKFGTAFAEYLAFAIGHTDSEIMEPPASVKDLNFIFLPSATLTFTAKGRVFSTKVTGQVFPSLSSERYASIPEGKAGERRAWEYLDQKPLVVIPNAIDDMAGFQAKARARVAIGRTKLTRNAISVGRQYSGMELPSAYEESYKLAIKVLYELVRTRKNQFETENAKGFDRWKKHWGAFRDEMIWPPQGLLGQRFANELKQMGEENPDELLRSASKGSQVWGLSFLFNTKPIDSPRNVTIWP